MYRLGALTNLRTKRSYDVPIVSAHRPTEFPWKWFQENPKSKPICRINIFKNSDLKVARQYAESFMSGHTTGVTAVVTYLYHMLATINETLNSDWITYGCKLPKDSMINPLSLLDIETKDIEPPNVTLGEVFDHTFDHSLLIGIAGVYRYSLTHTSNQETISSRINPLIAQVRPARENAVLLINTSTSNSNMLAGNDGIEIMLSALDM